MLKPELPSNYQLLDSGEGEKLELFGTVRLVRPSSLCIWKRRLPPDQWNSALARYVPKQGWQGRIPEDARVTLAGVPLVLQLQDNGQVGCFPEHASYLSSVGESLNGMSAGATVLNMFAYTGLATIFCARWAAQITHVDSSKRALDWAQANAQENKVPADRIRFIREDAISFARKEARRGKRYRLIIADPPSFSRLSEREKWELIDVLPEFVRVLVSLIDPMGGTLFLTSHHYETGEFVLENLLLDAALEQNRQLQVESRPLRLLESSSPRSLPAGFLTTGSFA